MMNDYGGYTGRVNNLAGSIDEVQSLEELKGILSALFFEQQLGIVKHVADATGKVLGYSVYSYKD